MPRSSLHTRKLPVQKGEHRRGMAKTHLLRLILQTFALANTSISYHDEL